ncbi:hypothetical protein [Natrinema hispanicum]|uniref:Uncharacterized protein n=1 Tax=Natrinema hispanicum TaxID=392421 RepID=A0A1G6SXH6_9EURY|nr:hypothetical protein [Natrinema hispanicum]RZV12383.1 hypothetical protein BDK88_1288 [Natrinema hispanicum]SDD20936.1 hypothetical protein SAMN05192552_101542 [Natrinema hispanicum]SET90967.1 hypothetical protein SAMN04488694_11642 [Natrinema hispanicum]
MSSAIEKGVDGKHPTDETDQVRELDHDEYDPIGTAILVGIYFLILVALWIFMYFIEFLGNGPTVTGVLLTVVGLA